MRVERKTRAGVSGLAACLFGVVAFAPATQAAENLGHFAAGAQTSYAAFLPPPGQTWFYGYGLLLDFDGVRDASGERVPGVDTNAFAMAPRLVHTWNRSWAGFKLSSGVLALGVHSEVEAGGVRSESTGVGMVGVEPLYFTRSFGPHWHVLTGSLLYFAVGEYERNELANYTVNYDAYAWQASVTWTPTPNWEASLNYGFEWKEENQDTGYKSGDQGNLSFGVGHRPFADKRWDLGVSGYFVDQLEDDELNGVTIGDGNRTRRFGIGPKLVYTVNPSVVLLFQWHNESNVRAAPRGDLFWFEFAFRV